MRSLVSPSGLIPKIIISLTKLKLHSRNIPTLFAIMTLLSYYYDFILEIMPHAPLGILCPISLSFINFSCEENVSLFFFILPMKHVTTSFFPQTSCFISQTFPGTTQMFPCRAGWARLIHSPCLPLPGGAVRFQPRPPSQDLSLLGCQAPAATTRGSLKHLYPMYMKASFWKNGDLHLCYVGFSIIHIFKAVPMYGSLV